MEFYQLGDLRHVISMTRERGAFFPDHLLWLFFKCLVKQCIAMEYPVRKFHPQRRDGQTTDLEEIIPPEYARWRQKQYVHFDFDPLNSTAQPPWPLSDLPLSAYAW